MKRRSFILCNAGLAAIAVSPLASRLAAAQGSDAAADGQAQAQSVNPAPSGELLFRAVSLIGTRYRYGGNSPETGFDCSGFVRYLFRDVHGRDLPRSANEIWLLGQLVERHTLQPGDLVFYNTLRRPFSHVGVFLGDHKFVHAPSFGGVVRSENMNERYWQQRWNGAKRIEA